MHAINTAQTNTSHRWRWQLHLQICVLCDDWHGSQEQHLEVLAKTLEHMKTIAPLVLGHIRGRSSAMSNFSSVKEYVQYTKMDKQGTWGTEI